MVGPMDFSLSDVYEARDAVHVNVTKNICTLSLYPQLVALFLTLSRSFIAYTQYQC